MHAKIASLQLADKTELKVLSTRGRFILIFLEGAKTYERILVEVLSDASFETLKKRRRVLSKAAKACFPFPFYDGQFFQGRRCNLTPGSFLALLPDDNPRIF